MSIGENIKKKRLELGISQKKLEKIAGVSGIWSYEANKKIPQLSVLIKIASALNCELDDLIYDK